METAVIIIAILGGVFGAILAIAGKKLAVEEDPRKDEILALLPGANCGGRCHRRRPRRRRHEMCSLCCRKQKGHQSGDGPCS